MNELEKAYSGIEEAIDSLDYEGNYDVDTPRESLEYIKIYIKNLQSKIDKAIEIIDLITPELWNISNKMTYRLKDVKNILKEDK